ncbi:MAG: SAM-dependent chlorinase/fluorinase [Deltaproteobacteria bacterium]|nr:SAM-dependent chlorinase/fluorinase [Deltaproteobacteria bacterium]
MAVGPPIITLTSDFGTADGYVGAMKGVLLAGCRQARLVDITHAIAPQDVRSAAWTLFTACRWFPPGTVHLAVVDPGVGSARRAIVGRTAGQLYVAPDNGLLSLVLGDRADVWQVDQEKYALAPCSRTFHGRDVFAPVAAALAGGEAPEACGTALDDWQRCFEVVNADADADPIIGEVVHVDRFGNLVTNIVAEPLDSDLELRIADHAIDGVSTSYSAVASGRWLCYEGSSGYLEVAVRDGSAAAAGLGRGQTVIVKRGRR